MILCKKGRFFRFSWCFLKSLKNADLCLNKLRFVKQPFHGKIEHCVPGIRRRVEVFGRSKLLQKLATSRQLRMEITMRISFLCAQALCIVCATAPIANAELTLEEILQGAPPILRVEEDWEVLVATPDPNSDIPQIVTVFGPTNAYFDTHTLFELNHGTLPGFGEGGMQLQVWYGDWLVGYLRQQAPVELAIPNEKIRYTTVTAINGDFLDMAIINGTSSTFGQFGQDNSLRARLYTSRTHLNPYKPNNSITHSRVTFGANRVSYFKRTAIRVFIANNELYVESNTDTFVHQLQ